MPKGIRIRLLAAAAFSAAAFSAAATAQQAAHAPARFGQVGEIVDHWTADQHLWVNGSLPVSDSHLADLEQWLGENAPNWTIVLMQNARGQAFQSFRGMDAVEHALGKQLANRTDFGRLEDARTGEANGAFFILFLEERKFSYYASDAFDKRSLGENHWVGRLDKPAIAAMRGGGRIVDAARDTVTSIESQLTRKIESEESARKRAVIERQRAIEEARQLPDAVSAEIARIEKIVSDYHQWGRLPEADDPAPPHQRPLSGDLFQLPLPTWRAGVKAIESHAGQDDANSARQLADQILGEIRKHEEDLIRWWEDRGKIRAVA